MSDKPQNLEDMNLALYIYEKGAAQVKENAVAIFLYSDGQTRIYAKPNTKFAPGLNDYSERVRSGLVGHTPWQQFNYLIRGAFPPNSEMTELVDDERSKVASILQNWDELK